MSKKSKRKGLSYDERNLQALYGVVKTGGEDSRTAMSLVSWYLANHFWTAKQRHLIRTIVKTQDVAKKTARKKVSEKKHYLYAIKGGEHVKLGFSCNIESRINALQTSSPHVLEEVWRFYCGMGSKVARKAERQLHRFCKKHHVEGEWYKLEAMELVKQFKVKE